MSRYSAGVRIRSFRNRTPQFFASILAADLHIDWTRDTSPIKHEIMEGHQQDSQAYIKNEQRKKHLRKRSCNRMLTDAITHELKRLSSLNDSTSSYNEHENRPIIIINQIYINHIWVLNQIPQNIVLKFPTVDKNIRNENSYEYSMDIDPVCKNGYHQKNNTLRVMNAHPEFENNSDMFHNDEGRNDSGIDVSRLFAVAKLLFEASQQLQRTVTQKPNHNEVVPSNFFVISVELENLRKLLNPTYKNNKITQFVHKSKLQYNTHDNLCNLDRFNTTIERNFIKFEFNVHKFDIFSKDFLRALQTFFSMYEMSVNCRTNSKVPCVISRRWHFQNFIQVYLLGLLLRNINVNSLNMLRKLYFVIITSSTANLTIEITIKLKNGIFMVYDNCLYDDVTNWSKCSKLFINKSVSMAALETLIQNRFNTINRTDGLKLMPYTTPQQSNPTIGSDQCLSRSESKENSSYYYVSDTDSLPSMVSEHSTVLLHRSLSSTLILPDEEETLENNEKDLPQSQATPIVNNIINNNHNMYNANFLHSKQWLIKLLPAQTCNDFNDKANIMDIFDYNSLKDTILDGTSIHMRHLEKISDIIWKQITSQSFYVLCLKSLGHSLANIFCSTVV